ncbi:MAG: lipid A deacylase LpxR family protein [Planctomycetota bacterium]|jgi:hypothetical protein
MIARLSLCAVAVLALPAVEPGGVTWRLEINNDYFFGSDDGFSNGWSVQRHGVRYANWEAAAASDWIKWVGQTVPGLDRDDLQVRIGQGIGQNMFTPKDITLDRPDPDDLPYAGTLSYLLSWQSFSAERARVFQIDVGIMGEPSLAEEFQEFVHNDLSMGDDPKGWYTQRDEEPVIGLHYLAARRLVTFGAPERWSSDVFVHGQGNLGNLMTSAECGLAFRAGWNAPQGLPYTAAPPARTAIQHAATAPLGAGPWSAYLFGGVRAAAIGYSVIYDGSLITSDDREVERNDVIGNLLVGLTIGHRDTMAVHLIYNLTSDLLEDAPEQTTLDNSYGSLTLDFFF